MSVEGSCWKGKGSWASREKFESIEREKESDRELEQVCCLGVENEEETTASSDMILVKRVGYELLLAF